MTTEEERERAALIERQTAELEALVAYFQDRKVRPAEAINVVLNMIVAIVREADPIQRSKAVQSMLEAAGTILREDEGEWNVVELRPAADGAKEDA